MKLVLQVVFLMLMISQALAEFVFEIQVFSIRTSRNADCSADDSTPQCETYLSIFCLRELNTTFYSTELEDCSFGSANGTLVYYYETLPLTRYIISDQPWPETFQLYINAKDRDDGGDEDDNIDDIFINMDLTADSRLPEIVDRYTGVEGNVTVRLSVRVYCAEGYYGEDCLTSCIPQDDDQNGHFACNADDGTPLCLNGFQNPDNNCVDSISATVEMTRKASTCTSGYASLAVFLVISATLNIFVIFTVVVLFKKLSQKNKELEELSKHKDHGIEMKSNEVYGLSSSFGGFRGNGDINGRDPRNDTLNSNYEYVTSHTYIVS